MAVPQEFVAFSSDSDSYFSEPHTDSSWYQEPQELLNALRDRRFHLDDRRRQLWEIAQATHKLLEAMPAIQSD